MYNRYTVFLVLSSFLLLSHTRDDTSPLANGSEHPNEDFRRQCALVHVNGLMANRCSGQMPVVLRRKYTRLHGVPQAQSTMTRYCRTMSIKGIILSYENAPFVSTEASSHLLSLSSPSSSSSSPRRRHRRRFPSCSFPTWTDSACIYS